MNVQIIIPPYVVRDGKAVVPTKAMLPVGPLVMATLLKARGCRVTVTDLAFHEDWQKHLSLVQPDVVLLSCHTVRNIVSCTAILTSLRSQWADKQPYVVLGGNCCTELGIADFTALGLYVDAVVRGFGHTSDVLEAILAKTPGDIRTSDSLGELAVPEVTLLPARIQRQYFKHSAGRYPMYGHGLGCRYYKACGAGYCAATLGQSWVPRSFNDIEQEVQQAKVLGYGEIWCVDNLLFVDPDQTLRFDRLVARYGMKWSGMARPEMVARQPLSYFQKFRALAEVAMGVEAAEVSSLKVLNRGATSHYAEDCLAAFGLINNAKIETNAFVMLDFPTYTEREFWKLFRFLINLETDMVSWSFYNPSVKEVANGTYQPNQYGFYHEPFGVSSVPQNRVIQHAMALSGVWWRQWHLNESEPFFEDETDVGVNFLEGQLLQKKTARDPRGDLWEVWLEKERGKAV